MGTNAVSPLNIDEYLRKLKLVQGFPSISGSDAPQAPSSAPPPSPLDEAKGQYMSALSSAPDKSQYHPSIGRRIVGALGGAAIGMTNPQGGQQFAHNAAYGPFDQKQSQYQQSLARKKEAFETEQSSAQEKARESELTAQRGAEESRAGAEEARRKSEEWKTSPEGQQFELKKVQFAHPGSPGQPFDLELSNGQKVNGATWTRDGWMDPVSKTIINSDLVTKATRVGSATQAQPRNANEYNDFHTGYVKTHPNANEAEISAAYDKQKAQIGAEFPRPQNPPQALVLGPDNKVINARPGTVLPPGTKTLGGMNSEQILRDKKVIADVQSKDDAVKAYHLAQTLADNDSPTDDYALVMQFIGATKPDSLAKLRLNNNEISLVTGTRNSFGDLQALVNKVLNGEKLIPEQRQNMVKTMKIIAESKGDTSQGGGTSGVLPGGITLDEINAEIERRKKK